MLEISQDFGNSSSQEHVKKSNIPRHLAIVQFLNLEDKPILVDLEGIN